MFQEPDWQLFQELELLPMVVVPWKATVVEAAGHLMAAPLVAEEGTLVQRDECWTVALKMEELQVREVAGKVVPAETEDRTFVVAAVADHPGVQH